MSSSGRPGVAGLQAGRMGGRGSGEPAAAGKADGDLIFGDVPN